MHAVLRSGATVLACLMLASAQALAGPPDIDALALSLGRAFVANPAHVGLSIGVTSNGARHSYHFGSIDRQRPALPTGRTIHELASLTKTYTGMLLARAVIDGKLALGDDVRRYLPAGFANLAFEDQPIRIVDLASHTSGLPKNLPPFPAGLAPDQLVKQYGILSRTAFLQALAEVRLGARPGTVFAYSNAGTQLVGLVLEQVYGMSYDALVQRMIAQPLAMVDTGMAVLPQDATRTARRYDGTGAPMPALAFWRDVPAAGFLKSTINDQLRYLEWNLDASDPVVALAHRVTFGHTSERGDDIALFWFVHHASDGRRVVRHAGGSFGSTSFALLVPDTGTGIVLLANDAGASTEGALAGMADQLAAALASGRSRRRP